MTQNNDERDDVLCDCTGTTATKIQQLIDSGVDNIDDIASATGATTGCGSCDILVMDLLEAQ